MAADSETQLPVIIVKTMFVSVVMVLAIIGNFSVLYVVQKNKKLRTVPNYFICSLAVADFFYALLGTSSIVVTTLYKRWVFGEVMCNFIGFTNSLFVTVSVWTLVAISVNRYIAVAKPLHVKQIFNLRRAGLVIICSWIFGVLVALPPLIGWSNYVSGLSFCIFNGKTHMSYSVFMLLINYVFTSLSMVCVYVKISLLITKQNCWRKTIATPNSSLSREYLDSKPTYKHSASSLAIIEKLQDMNKSETLKINMTDTTSNLDMKFNTRLNKEVKVTTMLALVVIAYFVCWTPFTVAAVLYAFNVAPTKFGFLTFGIVVTCTNGVINPLIYAVMNKNFKKAFKEMYRCNAK